MYRRVRRFARPLLPRAFSRWTVGALAALLLVDTVGVFSGEQRGDSLIGTFTGVTGRVVFLKRPSQWG